MFIYKIFYYKFKVFYKLRNIFCYEKFLKFENNRQVVFFNLKVTKKGAG